MNQTLTAVPQGLIESGTITLQADPMTGIITYTGNVEAGVGPFTKSFSDNGSLKIDPGLLLSRNIKAGQVFNFPDVAIKITAVDNDRAAASMSVNAPSSSLKGTVALDLTQSYWSITNVKLSGTADGEDVILELTSYTQ